MKRRGVQIFALLVLLVLVAGLCFGRMPKFFGEGIDPKQVHHINIFDGSTGEGFTIEDADQIRYVVENIQRIPMYRDGISLGNMGYGFQISYVSADERDVVPVFFLNGSNAIRKDPFLYRCDGGLCFDYLKELKAEILNTTGSFNCGINTPICIDGILYYDTGIAMPVEPDESAIEYVEIPLGGNGNSISAFARLEEGVLAVRIDHEWYRYTAEQTEGAKENAFSVGIIGGADGPTMIVVSGFVNWWKLFAIVGCGAAAALGIWIRKKHSEKR